VARRGDNVGIRGGERGGGNSEKEKKGGIKRTRPRVGSEKSNSVKRKRGNKDNMEGRGMEGASLCNASGARGNPRRPTERGMKRRRKGQEGTKGIYLCWSNPPSLLIKRSTQRPNGDESEGEVGVHVTDKTSILDP